MIDPINGLEVPATWPIVLDLHALGIQAVAESKRLHRLSDAGADETPLEALGCAPILTPTSFKHGLCVVY